MLSWIIKKRKVEFLEEDMRRNDERNGVGTRAGKEAPSVRNNIDIW
jgi:hypothetical protein